MVVREKNQYGERLKLVQILIKNTAFYLPFCLLIASACLFPPSVVNRKLLLTTPVLVSAKLASNKIKISNFILHVKIDF